MELNARGFVALAIDKIDGENRQWIEVIPTVTEARNGQWFFTITADDLEAYAESIRQNPGTIPVDYDHEGAKEDGSTKAAGWFTGEARVDERDSKPVLVAEVQWTPSGAQAVRDGDFKMISPEFSFHDRDAKTGLMKRAKKIIAATLTNRPFFRELAPVGATLWSPNQGVNQIQQMIARALNPGVDEYRYYVMDVDVQGGLALVAECGPGGKTFVIPFTLADDGVSLSQATDWKEAQQEWVTAARAALDAAHEDNTKLRAALAAATDDPTDDSSDAAKEETMDLSAIAAALGLPEDADEATILAATKKAKDEAEAKARRAAGKPADVAMFAAALGLDPDASEATVLAAVRKAAEDAETVGAMRDEHSSLTAQAAERVRLEQEVKTIQAERRQEKIQRLLSDAIRDGQVMPAEKSVLAKTFAENPDALLELINTRPKRGWAATGTGGEGAEDSIAVRTASAVFTSEVADGVDADSVRLHVRAEQYLAERGKKPGQYTDIEYAQACDAVALERQFA